MLADQPRSSRDGSARRRDDEIFPNVAHAAAAAVAPVEPASNASRRPAGLRESL